MQLPLIKISAFLILIIPTIYALFGAPFVPTPIERVRKMTELAKLKPGDKVYDLGCGDGRLVHIASKQYKSEATGYELSPAIYLLAKICQPFWRSKAKIKFGNFFNKDLSDAKVIFCYLMPKTMEKFEKKFKNLKKGTKVVSYAFKIPNLNLIHEEPRVPGKNFATIRIYEI